MDGVNVVLDFGVWAKDERSAPRSLAASVAATSKLVHLQVAEQEQWRRVQLRTETDAPAFEMTKADVERWQQTLQPPEETEIETAEVDPPPAGFDSWKAWAAQRSTTSLPSSGLST